MARYVDNAEALKGDYHPDFDGIYLALTSTKPYDIGDGAGDTFLDLMQLATMRASWLSFTGSERRALREGTETYETLRRAKIVRRLGILQFVQPEVTSRFAEPNGESGLDLNRLYRRTLMQIRRVYDIPRSEVRTAAQVLNDNPSFRPPFLRTY